LRRPGQDISSGLLIAETEPVTERAWVREIDDDEGRRPVTQVSG
jgi:hypothetical protein